MKCFRRNKTGRLFQTIFLIQCLLLGCVLAFVSLVMNRLVLREQTRELDASNLRVLEQKSRSVDNTVDRLQEQVRLFLSEKMMMMYLVNPKEDETEDSMEILTLMQRYVRLTSEVEQMWIYRPEKKDVLSSDGFFTPEEESAVAGLLQKYEDSAPERCEPDLIRSVMMEEGGIYLIIEFAPAARLGCFIFRLEEEYLGTVEAEGQEKILIVDAEGNVLIEGGSFGETEDRVELGNAAAFYTEGNAAHSPSQTYYRVDNEKLGWSLLMRITSQRVRIWKTAFWAVALPTLAVLMLLGGLAAWYISRRIYLPINRLLALVADRPLEAEAQKNEQDYLESAWRQTIEDNDRLHSRFRAIGTDMRQYFCRLAIHGQLEEQNTPENLETVIPKGYFQAVLVRMESSRLQLQNNPLQFSLLSKALHRLASQIPEFLCGLEESPETMVLVFVFPDLESRPDVSVLEGLLAQAEKETSSRLVCGTGIACDGLARLKESYEQGMKDLQYKLYLAGEPDSHEKGESNWKKALDERLVPLVESAIASDEPVEEFARQITRTAEYGARDDQEKLRGYLYAQDLLLEKLLFQEEILEGMHLLQEGDGPSAGRGIFETFCRQALVTGRELMGKKQYWYVEEGKAFMRENFQNSSLGVSDISGHVGISAAYFSSLFNELSQESVTSYLNGLRVEQAKVMLGATHIPVKDVGFRCGFNSANVFGRVFKKYTGQSPKQYRDQVSGNA